MTTLRLLSWNVRHLLGDPLAVHRVLRAASPDLVCLQEAPRLPWSGFQLGATARASGLLPVAGGWSGAGTAILCSARVRVHSAQALTFPRTGAWSVRRGAVLASVGLSEDGLSEDGLGEDGLRDRGLSDERPPGSVLRLACVHLGLDAAERLAHVQELCTRLPASGLPVVVAGDLNEPPDGPAWRAFAAVARDPSPSAGPTFPASSPRRRIDAVLTGPGVELLEYGTWHPSVRDAVLASDHLPVLAVLRL